MSATEPYKGFPTYYLWLAAEYRRKRDIFVTIIDNTPGLTAVVPDGAFYVMARHTEETSSPLALPGADADRGMPDQVAALVEEGRLSIDPETLHRADYNFVRRLAVERSVVGIPPSAFYCAEHAGQDLASNFVRFAFCKKDGVLEDARRRLLGLKSE